MASASFNALEAVINAYIKQNGVKAITGQILNGVLRAMVAALGKGWTIADGNATPTTDPGVMTGPVAYIAHTAGTYEHFGNLVVNDGEVVLLKYNEQTWTKEVIASLAASATVDGNVGTPAVGVSWQNGVLSFDFHNLKGTPGTDGVDGAAAGFGTIDATVDGNIGTPGVTVQTSGPNTAKNMTFQFTNLKGQKGDTGVTSVVATVDNTSGNPSCTVSLVGQELHLDFHGLKGSQGDTGVSADYPITIVNNLTTNDPASALSAAMGVQLEGEISQLELKVGDLTVTAEQTSLLSGIAYYTPGTVGQNISNYYSASGGKSTIYYNTADVTGLNGTIIITPLAGEGSSTPSLLWAVVDASGVILDCEEIQDAGASYSRQIDITSLNNPSKIYFAYHKNNSPTVNVKIHGLTEDISKLKQEVQNLGENVQDTSSSVETLETQFADIAEPVYSSNLYDKTQLREGYVQEANGVFSATSGNDNYLTSPVIPIVPNRYYQLVGRGNNGSVKAISCLDGNGDPVKVKAPENGAELATFILPNADGTDSVRNGEFLTPDSAVSVQFTVKFNGTGTPNDVMLVDLGPYYIENPATPTYEEYGITGYRVKESAIPDNPLNGKSVIFAGDSICNASTDYSGGGGWAKRIGVKNNMNWQNLGISGGTITDKNVVGSSFTISDTNFGTGADYIILEGGTNDADRIGSIIEGTTPENYGSYSPTGYTDTFTNQTFCGAVEYLLKKVITDYPSAKVGFIIAMKMGRTNDYTKEGNNRRAYFETIIQLCKKWGVPVLNLWDECTMNPRIASHYTSGQKYLYVDGQHPTGRGYDLVSPIIEAWMKTL